MEYTILILLLPLLSFLVLGLGGKWMSHRTAGLIGTAVLGAVAVLSYLTAIHYFTAPRLADGTFATLMPYNCTWLPFTPTLSIDLGILLDPISVMMLIVISTVSFMVHLYSFGYMKGERGFQRYYAFLSLFTMSMLGLVVATNIFQMYLFWELVGVSSYLLIGFYYTKPAAIAASKKAFIVTRFADLGFLIGILVYGYYAGTYTFQPNEMALLKGGAAMIPLALGLMFIGGAGKSAMFPLHIWLPDAMEGPTPVSALIHAATMVVAGVYLVARMFPLFIDYAPHVLHLVAYVGAFTAFYAASVACVQSDIKRVLAFSTISQIGFMMVALGVCTSTDPHEGGLGYMARHVPLVYARHVQGVAVPRCRKHHPCGAQQRDVRHGRLAQIHAGYAHHLPDSLPCHCRHSPVLRILLQGRDTDGLLPVQPRHGLDYDGDCRHDRILYVQTVLRHFLGQLRSRGRSRQAMKATAISTRLTSRPLP